MVACEECPEGQVSAKHPTLDANDRCLPAPAQAEIDLMRDLAHEANTCFEDVTEADLARGLCGWHLCRGTCRPGGKSQPNVDCEVIDGATRITEITLIGCNMTMVPASISAATEVGYLNMEDNDLSTLPCTALNDLTKLRTLVLRYNKIDHLDEDCFAGNTMMNQLALTNNRLTQAPSFPSLMPSLSTIFLEGNEIEALGPSYNATHMPALWRVFLRNNKLRSVPEGLINHGNLFQFENGGNPNDLVSLDDMQALLANNPIRKFQSAYSDSPIEPGTASAEPAVVQCPFSTTTLTCDFTVVLKDGSAAPVSYGGNHLTAVIEHGDADRSTGRRALQADAPDAFVARDNKDGTYLFQIPMENVGPVGTTMATLYVDGERIYPVSSCTSVL